MGGRAPRVRQRQHPPSLVPALGAGRGLPPALASRPGGVRRVGGHRLALAGGGRSPHQGPPGEAWRQGRIRPTGEKGTQRHLLVDATGVPPSLVVSGANVNDPCGGSPPPPAAGRPAHFCVDEGYNYPVTQAAIAAHGYVAHITPRGQEAAERRHAPWKRARRWVVEACHSWLNRFRKLLVRFEKKDCNYVALLEFARAIICWRHAGVLG